MKTRLFLTILLITGLVFLAGCDNNPVNPTATKSGTYFLTDLKQHYQPKSLYIPIDISGNQFNTYDSIFVNNDTVYYTVNFRFRYDTDGIILVDGYTFTGSGDSVINLKCDSIYNISFR